ncbi:MAG: HD domain-containing phosphohydrolase [Deltaproteobacteria bacterium]
MDYRTGKEYSLEKILLVDDEQSVLDAFYRQLRKKYNMETAVSGSEGLKKIADSGPFAVIISDMRMPVMDGLTFLMEVRQVAPESVRMMLTGNTDQQTAIEAINRGAIFRFLTKPCTHECLTESIDAGLEQYRLITAEKELLEKTLKGSIKILTDILSLAYPIAFSQSLRLRKYAAQIAQKLNLFGAWQYEIAAMLSSVGFINVPTETIEKYMAGGTLSKEEKEMVAAIPETTGMLLANIPRLSTVASMITQRDMAYTDPLDFASRENGEGIRIGANMLKVITDFDLLLLQNQEPEDAIKIMARQHTLYDSTILDVLTTIDLPRRERVSQFVKINELQNGMIIDADIFNSRGFLIIPKGYEVNEMTSERLKNFLFNQGKSDTIRIMMSVYKE